MTRAEVSDPRTDLGDLAVAEGVISSAARQLAGSLLTAYRKNQTVFFYYKLRESSVQWDVSPSAPRSN